ncbi:Ac92-like protein [Crangon crangon nudivirus]|uniref:Sulfhydryl oxidase n=1 Tax=Crangon crangon nudivirus TaxID=2880838 RepID=A0AAE8Y0M2_9VIRU|nr:Ac92-like protein [Crangon crangon nudivirus]UBZ25488.1 Ac92-like protein [Crangon crangon nudivirus]
MPSITVEENDVSVYRYELQDPEHAHKEFKQHAGDFLTYLKFLVPNKSNIRMYIQYTTYQMQIVEFVSKVLTHIGHKHTPFTKVGVGLFNSSAYNNEKLLEMLDLYTYVKLDATYLYKSVWGRTYWFFLHFTSLLIKDDKTLIDTFASILLNFNLALLCGDCSVNYKAKDPLKTLTVRINETQDPITSLYLFHNIVNTAIHSHIYPIENFLTMYKLEQHYIKDIAYSVKINY